VTRLDRYIARQYLLNIAALLVLMFTLIVAIDVLLNLARFFDAGADISSSESRLRVTVATILWIIDLWGPRTLQLFGHLYGMVLVAAMGFTCAQLVRRRELVAALASGLSLQRIARPFFVVALLITGVQAVNQELLIPRVAHLLTRGHGDALRRSIEPFEVALLRDSAGRILYARVFDAENNTLLDVHVWERDGAGRIARRIRAESARWDGEGWALTNARAETRAGPTGSIDTRTRPIERLDTDIDPTSLVVRRFDGFGQNLSWRQIRRTLANEQLEDDARDRFQRLQYGRLSTWIGNLLALAIAIPFFLVREPRNMILQTTRCAPVAAIALVGAAVGPAAAVPGLPAWLGVFIPAMALAPIALAMLVSVRT